MGDRQTDWYCGDSDPVRGVAGFQVFSDKLAT